MTSFNRLWGILPALTLAAGLGTASVAMAQSSSTMSMSMGATTGLGTHHRFSTVAAAKDHCPDDTIVWSSGKGMTYHNKMPSAAKAGHGFYACKMEADSARFHPVD